MIKFLEPVVDKGDSLSVGQGALYSVVAILMVFAILLIIIGVTTLIFKINGLFEMKKEIDSAKKAANNTPVSTNGTQDEVVISDDDMMAAVLVATIDYRNEVKKDVKVVSVKEVK